MKKKPERIAWLLGWALVVAVAVGTFPAVARGQQSAQDMKARIVQLLTQLHDPDPKAAAQARTELKQLGLADEDIQTGWQLKHPQPAVRRELAQTLGRAASPQHADLVLELTKDPDRQVRLAALEAVRAMPRQPQLVERIRQIAASDGDPIVRGNARLLAAEMNAGVTATSPAPGMKTAPANPAGLPMPPMIERPAGDAGDVLSKNNPFERSPSPIDQPMPAISGLPKPSNFQAPRETAALPVRTSNSSFNPVQPFWTPGANLEEIPVTAGGSEAGGEVGSFWAIDPQDDADIEHAGGFLGPDGNLIKTPLGPIGDVNPDVLNRPFREPFTEGFSAGLNPIYEEVGPFLVTGFEPPNGFSGPSSVIPREVQTSSHFIPVEDRWRIGYPEWDRYGRGHPWVDDYPFIKGHWWDPYNQNVLKGDYPIIGQHTFLNLTVQERFFQNFQKNPIGTTPFESTRGALQENFFGRPRNFLSQNYLSMQVDLFHGSTAAFKPLDWQVRLQPIFNRNVVQFNELAQVNPDVRKGLTRTRYDFALEQYFVEAKLADLSADYDFASVRAGSQPFTSDFRGFVFSDINRGIRLFGTQFGNRDQFNLIAFDETEKNTNSLLNTFQDRNQNVFIANYYRQDFIFPGYTAQLSYHYNTDGPSFKFDRNNFLVRPDPVGVFQPHRVQAHYFGFNGDGHIGRINVTNSFYWVTGKDSRNPLANSQQQIDAKFFALELSIDREWARFRTSYLYSSGDDDINDNTARGFDTILDNPNFAGGEFSYWQRQAVRLFGVNLVQNMSFIPNLRSSKIQGQSNFVNPGLHLINAGMDFEVTPKMKILTNANYMWFDTTRSLEVFTFQDNIDPEIGLDLSMGMEYRPFLNDNVVIIGGLAMLIPGKGFDDLFGKAIPEKVFGGNDKIQASQLYSNFIEVILQY